MKALPVVQAGFGMVQLAAPGLLPERLLGQRLDQRARLIARILGTRHLAQACLSGPAPTIAVLALGAEVDAAHAASMIGLAVSGPRWRRAALASAAVAAGFATAGGLAARRAAGHLPEPASQGGMLELRDRWADALARHLVPGATWRGTAPLANARMDCR